MNEFKEMGHKAWSEKFNYLCIDMTKNKNGSKYRIFNESKNTYIECVPQNERFFEKKCCIQLKIEKIWKI